VKSNKRQKKKDELRRRNIRAAMVRRGIIGAEISRKLGISRQMVSNVVAGRDVSGRVVQALIDAGVPAKYFQEARYAMGGTGAE
jgi:hypothetical protein